MAHIWRGGSKRQSNELGSQAAALGSILGTMSNRRPALIVIKGPIVGAG
jgi:hypothetical protein